MNVEQHLKVAEFHIKTARQHAADGEFKCGCPAGDHQKELEAIEAEIKKASE